MSRDHEHEEKETTVKLMPCQPMPAKDVLFYIAQGAVNIAEGHTTIEAGSPVHRAMEDLCYYATSDLAALIDVLKTAKKLQKKGAKIRQRSRTSGRQS